MTARPPAQWAPAERAFHLAYLDDPAPFPRTPVWYRLRFSSSIDGSGGHVGFAAAVDVVFELFHHWRHDHEVGDPATADHAELALWPTDAEPGDRAFLIFEADPVACAALPRVSLAAGVGEVEPNGAMCIEVVAGRAAPLALVPSLVERSITIEHDVLTIWPTYNPAEPVDWIHGWDR